MLLHSIQVESYAGHKADETPRRFQWQGQEVRIVDVVDRWHQRTFDPEWPMADYFKVAGADHRLYLIKHDLEADEWFLCRIWSLSRSKQ